MKTLLVAGAALFFLAAGCAGPAWRIEREELLDGYRTRASDRPVLVVDLDDTVVRGSTWNSIRLFGGLWYGTVSPFENSPETLKDLAERWNLIFLTARDDIMGPGTLAWLDRHGFPQAPVVFSRHMLFTDSSRLEYKKCALRHVLERGFAPGWGVGDKALDIEAYQKNGLRTAMILDGPGDPDAPGCRPEVTLTSTSQAWAKLPQALAP